MGAVRIYDYIIESKVQWKPFWLAAQQYPQNDWLGGNFPYTMTYMRTAPIKSKLTLLFMANDWR